MFKIIKKTKIITFFMMLVVGLATATVANATTNTDIDFNGKLINGVDTNYWLDPGNSYTGSTPDAVRKLRYPSGMYNPIVLTLTTTKKSSKLDVYQYYDNDRNNAYNEVFRTAGADAMYTSDREKYDWLYGNIMINYRYMESYDRDLKSTIILHEMLHNYGAKDISKTNSIMYYQTPNVRGMTSDANTVLNNKY